MESFITWLYDSFVDLIVSLTSRTIDIITMPIEILTGSDLFDYDINLVLFSDTPILTTNAYELLLLFFSIFYSIIFVVIVYKIIKKVVVKITRWNKW